MRQLNLPMHEPGDSCTITLFKVSFSHLYCTVFQRVCEAISDYSYKIARDSHTYLLDYMARLHCHAIENKNRNHSVIKSGSWDRKDV